MKIYNKGSRTFQLGGDKVIKPGLSVEVENKVAKQLIKDYPRDLIAFEQGRNTEGVREEIAELNARIAELEADKAALKEAAQKHDETVQGLVQELKDAQDLINKAQGENNTHLDALEATKSEIDALTAKLSEKQASNEGGDSAPQE